MCVMMTKGLWKKAIALAAALAALLAVTACGDDGIKVDPNRTQLYIGYYSGGLGTEWMSETIRRFEAKYPKYQVIPDTGKSRYDSALVYDNFSSYNADIFLIDYCNPEQFMRYVNAGYAADITDAASEPVADSEGSILDKMSPFLKDYYYNAGKAYSLPWYQASYQMAYDVQLFEDERFYKDANGTWNDGSGRHTGRDGKDGTYDDGLPRTYTEFFALLDRMIDRGVTPLTWTGENSYYFNSLLLNLFADYEGFEDFKLNYSLNGTDSDIGQVDLDSGWRLKTEQKGKQYALQFARDIMKRGKSVKNADYFSSSAFMTSQDNAAAQSEFLTSRWTNKKIAMLVEGAWWETEASAVMSLTAQQSGAEYAYGERRFGVMPLPKADDGSSHGGSTVAAVSATSRVFVNGKSDRQADAKLFLKFLHTDEILSAANGYTNVPRPYSYTLSDADSAKMTPYGKEIRQMYSDSQIVFDELPLCDFLRYDGAKYISYLGAFSAGTQSNPAKYFLTANGAAEDYLNIIRRSQTEWESSVAAFRAR
jgi:ABC-type glycerol-3-phosphate transport system substrate-binding protein